jgi:Xaa-Pro aminopeptidase
MVFDPRRLHMSHRMEAFRYLLKEKNLDGYLLTHLSDLFYFTDYRSEGYYGLISRDDAWLFLPNLLYEQGKANTFGFHCLQGKFFPTLQSILKRKILKKVGFDPNQLPYSFGASLVKLGFLSVPGLVAKLRSLKDPLEMKRLRAANHLAALGVEFIRERLKPGRKEKELAADLGRFFGTKGDGIAFDLIIAGGPNSSYPHHITSDYRLKKGEPVICDIGATWQGYRSDLTRTFPLGKMPPLFSRVYRIVEKAQKEGIRRLRPGVTAGSVDQASRAVIKKRGFGSKFVHSTGHGVGIDIHERPRIGPGAKDKLESGMVVTIEPGIYLPGKFGVRIEDTLLVTPDGSELLTK